MKKEIIATLLAVSVQFFAVVWYISKMDSKINILYDKFEKENIILPKKYNSFKPLINKKNRNRLECIMLPFNAVLKALKI